MRWRRSGRNAGGRNGHRRGRGVAGRPGRHGRGGVGPCGDLVSTGWGGGIRILREASFAPEVLAEGPGGPAARRQGPLPELGIVGPESQEKRALVLSPFHWHVPDIEHTPAVAGILSPTRGYEGRVTHLSNEEEILTTVGLGSFMQWDEYDVVHVSTHGSRVCSDGGCRATLVPACSRPCCRRGRAARPTEPARYHAFIHTEGRVRGRDRLLGRRTHALHVTAR